MTGQRTIFKVKEQENWMMKPMSNNIELHSEILSEFEPMEFLLSRKVVKEKPILENWQSLQKLSLGASETLQSPSNHQILIS